MAKEVAESKGGGKGLQKWDAELAKFAKEEADREQTPTGQFISVRGGRISVGGNAIKGDSIDVVVVDSVFENDYYVGKFDPKVPRSPVCFAFGRKEDEMKPHEKSTDVQHGQCSGCKWNEFGTSKRGKGKACKNIRRLALLSADGLSAETAKSGNIMYLRVPVTSTKGWAFFVKGLAGNMGLPTFGVVTTITVVPDDDDQFKVNFAVKEPIDKKTVMALMARRKTMSDQIMFPYLGAGEGEEKAGKADKKAGGKKSKF